MMKKYFQNFATVFGIGRIPFAPGTWGSLVALPLAYGLMSSGPLYHMTACLLLFPVAVFASEAYEQAFSTHDAKQIVIDEVLGMLITMTWLPISWQSFVFGFFIFRLLDILKPFPISYLDKKIPGGLGVVIDDVAAGILGNLVLQIIYNHTMWLGSQVIITGGS